MQGSQSFAERYNALGPDSRIYYAQDELDALQHDTAKTVNDFFAAFDRYRPDSGRSDAYILFLMKRKINYALTVAIAIRYTSSELKTYADWRDAAIEREPVIAEMGRLLGINLYAMTTKECDNFFFPPMER